MNRLPTESYYFINAIVSENNKST